MKRMAMWGLILVLTAACVRPYPGGGEAPAIPAVSPPDGAPATQAALPAVQTPAAMPPRSEPLPYAVVLVGRDSGLNLRSAPALDAPALALLPYDARDLHPTGNRREADGLTWVEIESAYGSGWVSAAYLTRQVAAEVVCRDAQVQALIDAFVQAVQQRDGAALAGLVSPVHGLTVQHEWWNPPVTISAAQVRSLFEDETVYFWGLQDGSGMPLEGSFSDAIVPLLQEVLQNDFRQVCNSLEYGVATGGTAGRTLWPYPNLPFVALYRPAPEDAAEMDWRTWALGIVWENGRPYLAALIQYHWEI